MDDRVGNTKNDTLHRTLLLWRVTLSQMSWWWFKSSGILHHRNRPNSQKRVTCLLLPDPKDTGIIVLQNNGKYIYQSTWHNISEDATPQTSLRFSPCSVRAVWFVTSQHNGQLDGWWGDGKIQQTVQFLNIICGNAKGTWLVWAVGGQPKGHLLCINITVDVKIHFYYI